MKLLVGSFLAQTLKNALCNHYSKWRIVPITFDHSCLRQGDAHSVTRVCQWWPGGLEELSRQPRIEWDVADRAIKFLLQPALKAECMYTFQSLLGHQLMKLSMLLSSSSDSQHKTRALRSVHSFTANPGVTTDTALLKNTSSFFNTEKSLWHSPSKVIWWQLSFWNQIHNIP